MIWRQVSRADVRARELADRHYSRQKPGTPCFTPPGRVLVLYTESQTGRAVWATSYPYTEYVNRAYPDAWMCSLFRNEGAGIASELIRDAVAATIAKYEQIPPSGMLTLIDRSKVRPIMVHGIKTWGRTYRLAGFREAGETKGGLLMLRLIPGDMPPACSAIDTLVPMVNAEIGGAKIKHDTSHTT